MRSFRFAAFCILTQRSSLPKKSKTGSRPRSSPDRNAPASTPRTCLQHDTFYTARCSPVSSCLHPLVPSKPIRYPQSSWPDWKRSEWTGGMFDRFAGQFFMILACSRGKGDNLACSRRVAHEYKRERGRRVCCIATSQFAKGLWTHRSRERRRSLDGEAIIQGSRMGY